MIVIGLFALFMGFCLLGWQFLLVIAIFYVGLYFLAIYYGEDLSKAESPQKNRHCKLEFDGIKVTGPIEAFEDALIKKGWKYGIQPETENTSCLVGTYYNKKQVELQIEYTCLSNTVMVVTAIVGGFSNIEELSFFSNQMCEALGKKAGTAAIGSYDLTVNNRIEVLYNLDTMSVLIKYTNLHNCRFNEFEKKKLVSQSSINI